MQDSIIQEIVVKASKERVYSAIADQSQITQWFPDKIEGSLAVGQKSIFVFINENHKAQVYVEAARPFDYFSYRWVPGSEGSVEDVLTVPNTLVEFFIEDVQDGTKVTVKESGFASLPAKVAEKAFTDNSGGWEYMINRLKKKMNE